MGSSNNLPSIPLPTWSSLPSVHFYILPIYSSFILHPSTHPSSTMHFHPPFTYLSSSITPSSSIHPSSTHSAIITPISIHPQIYPSIHPSIIQQSIHPLSNHHHPSSHWSTHTSTHSSSTTHLSIIHPPFIIHYYHLSTIIHPSIIIHPSFHWSAHTSTHSNMYYPLTHHQMIIHLSSVIHQSIHPPSTHPPNLPPIIHLSIIGPPSIHHLSTCLPISHLSL